MELAEIADFLDDSRAEAREMAAEAVAGTTATAEGTAALAALDGVLPKLLALLSRAAEAGCAAAASHAAAAAVNLSQLPAERLKLVDAGAVAIAAASTTVEKPPELSEYSAMLLSNLTQFKSAQDELAAEQPERLLRLLAAAPIAEERHSHLALVLTNVAQNLEARAALLAALAAADDDGRLVSGLCDQLGAVDAPRRIGVARFLRNLAFAAKPSAPAGQKLSEGGKEGAEGGKEGDEGGKEGTAVAAAREALLGTRVLRVLIARLAARLAPVGAAFSSSERAEFAPELAAHLDLSAPPSAAAEAADKARKEGGFFTGGDNDEAADGGGAAERTATHQEPNIEGREAMTEALLLLSAAPVARVAMREMGIYPCLREAHLCEEGDDDEHGLNSGRAVRDANEQLVELFYLSAEAVAQPMAKVSVSEHSVSEQTAVDERVPAAADDVVSAEIPD